MWWDSFSRRQRNQGSCFVFFCFSSRNPLLVFFSSCFCYLEGVFFWLFLNCSVTSTFKWHLKWTSTFMGNDSLTSFFLCAVTRSINLEKFFLWNNATDCNARVRMCSGDNINGCKTVLYNVTFGVSKTCSVFSLCSHRHIILQSFKIRSKFIWTVATCLPK